MFENFRKLLSRPDPLAATAAKGALPSAPLPKARPGQGSFPGYVTSQQVSTSAIQLTDLQTANSDLVGTYRLGANTPTVIRNLAQVHPDLAAAVAAHLRIGIPEKYIAIARSGTLIWSTLRVRSRRSTSRTSTLALVRPWA